jgi:hypothetical protein
MPSEDARRREMVTFLPSFRAFVLTSSRWVPCHVQQRNNASYALSFGDFGYSIARFHSLSLPTSGRNATTLASAAAHSHWKTGMCRVLFSYSPR